MSACDGQLVLAEYCEQHPPLLMSTGMATRVKNYYRRPEVVDSIVAENWILTRIPWSVPPSLPPQRQVKSHAPRQQFGETTYVQSSSYFLGQLHSGQLLQSFETNLFRAPVSPATLPVLSRVYPLPPSLPPSPSFPLSSLPPSSHQVYRHTVPDTDLVVIISGSQVFVRDVCTVFIVGQECPKVEVPPPNSKPAMQFQKDFLLVTSRHTASTCMWV